jgi:thiamine kinase-like enzyme
MKFSEKTKSFLKKITAPKISLTIDRDYFSPLIHAMYFYGKIVPKTFLTYIMGCNFFKNDLVFSEN